MNYTPEPWIFTIEPRDKTWPGLYAVKTNILSYGIDGEEGIYLDNPADAHLIAAAPMMLEELKRTLMNVKSPEATDWEIVEERLTRIIAQAEGKA